MVSRLSLFCTRSFAVAACAAAFAFLGAAPAVAAPALRIQPAAHGHVKVGLIGTVPRGRLVYVLDRQGRLLARGTGPRDWASPAGRRLLDALLTAKSR